MNPVLFVLPLIPALLCWLLIKLFIRFLFKPVKPVKILGINFYGFLPQHKETIAVSLAEKVQEFLGADFLQQKLAATETLEKAMPVIEAHIDDFLTHKLVAELPVISMFVGDKIMNQLKALFLKELKELFPSVMSQFIGDLSHSEELKHEMVVKLKGIQIETIEEKFFETYQKDVKKIEFVFAFTGFVAGLIQLIITIVALK